MPPSWRGTQTRQIGDTGEPKPVIPCKRESGRLPGRLSCSAHEGEGESRRTPLSRARTLSLLLLILPLDEREDPLGKCEPVYRQELEVQPLLVPPVVLNNRRNNDNGCSGSNGLHVVQYRDSQQFPQAASHQVCDADDQDLAGEPEYWIKPSLRLPSTRNLATLYQQVI